jgi:hypothetical protein
MTPEEILEKAKTESLSKEELTAMVSDLAPDEQIKFRNLAANEAKETLSQMTALRAEKNRVETKIKDAEPQTPPTPAPDPMAKFREEQLLKAEIKFKHDFKLSDDEFTQIKDQFGRVDSGRIDADLIYKDFVGAYAFVNSEALIATQQKQSEMQQGATQATIAAAGTFSGDPASGQGTKEYSPEVKALAEQAGIPVEVAAQYLDEGITTTRFYQ